jgi:hypothetical protein
MMKAVRHVERELTYVPPVTNGMRETGGNNG